MRIPQDARFRAERERYGLRFCCESCVMFEPEAERCALRYPTDDHRRSRYDDPRVEVVFCKDFELA